MATISLKIQPYGGLVVGTVFLSNANPGQGTIGIKRDSDGFVIVPAETAMTSVGNDIWTYTTSVLSSLVNYTAYIRVEYLNESDNSFARYEQVVATIRGSMSPTSLRNLRRALQRRLGAFVLTTTTEPSASVSSITSSELINDDADSTYYDKGWLYICDGANAGKQGRVAKQGFGQESGQITIVRPLPETTESGVEVEWSARLPAVQEGKLIGIREVLNQALSGLWTIDRVTAPDADELYTELNSLDWLRDHSRIIQIEYPGSGGSWPVSYAGAYSFRYDAERPLMIGPSGINTATQPLSIAAYRPLNTWIKRGGAWQEADGLVDDTDECLGDPVLIREVALWWAYKALSAAPYEGQVERNRWEALAAQQAIIAANIKKQSSPREEPGHGLQWGWEPWSKELVPIRRRI